MKLLNSVTKKPSFSKRGTRKNIVVVEWSTKKEERPLIIRQFVN